NTTPTTQLYTLSLHDALPISTNHSAYRDLANRTHTSDRSHCLPVAPSSHDGRHRAGGDNVPHLWMPPLRDRSSPQLGPPRVHVRSEEHTSELQSRGHLVYRLL